MIEFNPTNRDQLYNIHEFPHRLFLLYQDTFFYPSLSYFISLPIIYNILINKSMVFVNFLLTQERKVYFQKARIYLIK